MAKNPLYLTLPGWYTYLTGGLVRKMWQTGDDDGAKKVWDWFLVCIWCTPENSLIHCFQSGWWVHRVSLCCICVHAGMPNVLNAKCARRVWQQAPFLKMKRCHTVQYIFLIVKFSLYLLCFKLNLCAFSLWCCTLYLQWFSRVMVKISNPKDMASVSQI